MNFFVASYARQSVYKVTEAGSASVFATKVPGPFGIAAGPDDFLYVASLDTNQILRIAPDGKVSPFTVLGIALDRPVDVAFDSEGNLYIACARDVNVDNGYVVKVSPGGIGEMFADGLDAPVELCFDGDDLLVANYCGVGPGIVRVKPDGEVETQVENIGPVCFYGLARDEEGNIYHSIASDGRIFKNGVKLAQTSNTALGLAKHGDSLYSCNQQRGIIHRITLPASGTPNPPIVGTVSTFAKVPSATGITFKL